MSPLSLAFRPPFLWIIELNNNTECVSELGDFATLNNFCFGNTGANAAIAIFPRNLKCLDAMEPWTGSQSVFDVQTFYQNGENLGSLIVNFEDVSVLIAAVLSLHVIKTWVRNIEVTSSTLKKKDGSVKTVRTPEGIAVVTEAIDRTPHRSAGRHSVCHSGCLKPPLDGFYTKIFTCRLR
jgi:hypothetical protein